MKRFFKIFFIFFMIIVVIAGCSFGIYAYKTSTTGNLNVVIIGVDAREGDTASRSDSLMIAHINESHKEIQLVSIPRDSYVYLPSEDRNEKITHAYAYGKKEATLKAVNHLFEQTFEYYIEVDFNKMISLVDSIGGIDLTPTATFCEMNEVDAADSYCFNEGEKVHMNGSMALSYARHRKSDSDLFRAQRQQEVIKEMIKEVKGDGPLSVYNFYRDVEKISDTNLSFMQLVGYMDMVFSDFEMKQEVLEGYSDTIYDSYYGQYLSYFLIDEEALKQKIEDLKK